MTSPLMGDPFFSRADLTPFSVFGRNLRVKMGPDTDFLEGDSVGLVINRGVFIVDEVSSDKSY